MENCNSSQTSRHIRIPMEVMLQYTVSERQLPGFPPELFQLLGWGLRMCITNKFPAVADVADLRITPFFRELLVYCK